MENITENTMAVMKEQRERTAERIDRKMLGRRIREERRRLGLTQEEVAARIDVSTTYIGYIERGERSVTLEKLALLAQCFRVTIDSLLKERPGPADPRDKGMRAENKLYDLWESSSADERDLILSITETIVSWRE